MNPIMRRKNEVNVHIDDGETVSAQAHRAHGLFVSSEVHLGIEPMIHIAWAVIPEFWRQGYTLRLFRSTTGFCPEQYPDDLNRHGHIVAEAVEDGIYEEHPQEGTYYFTLVLYRKKFFHEKVSVLRIAKTVPSMKVALDRIKDRMALAGLRQQFELSPIEHASKLNEARLRLVESQEKLNRIGQTEVRPKSNDADPVISAELKAVDDLFNAISTQEQKLEEIQQDPRFKKLSSAGQELLVESIRRRLDPREISARGEMKGS